MPTNIYNHNPVSITNKEDDGVKLARALSEVAKAAQQLSDRADNIPIVCGDFLVDVDDMEKLRTSLQQWSQVSKALLKTV